MSYIDLYDSPLYIYKFSGDNSFFFPFFFNMYIYICMYFQREVSHDSHFFLYYIIFIISGFQEYVIVALNSTRNSIILHNTVHIVQHAILI